MKTLWMVVLSLLVISCSENNSVNVDMTKAPLAKLSEYGFFSGQLRLHNPVPEVVPYDLNTPLFSDYTHKRRFVYVPNGTAAIYDAEEAFDFPVGTIIIKTFSMPFDMRDFSKGERILETRLLIRHESQWKTYPYIWNNEQTEATLELVGDLFPVSWTHYDGSQKEIDYVVPNVNDCKGCHFKQEQIVPIGPKAKHLNRDFLYGQQTENQLAHWVKKGILKDVPDPKEAPRNAVWDDEKSGSLDARARAYLDINCAHCHNPQGPGNNSGLDLRSNNPNLATLGLYKAPVAAGRGSGGLEYDLIPKHPEKSILFYRMNSANPEAAMPELGKVLVHQEGVALIRKWIEQMPEK